MGPQRTPDGRYIIVSGRLWRAANPDLSESQRIALVRELMTARRDVGTAMRRGDVMAAKWARARVHEAKVALGERGPVWWTDGTPDYNRRLLENTPYAEGRAITSTGRSPASATARRPVRPKAKADGGPPPGA